MPEERKHRGNRGNNRFPDTDFERIFHPASIAILGVSSDENSVGFGTGMLRVLKEMGFAGRIYPVNPSGGSVLGLKIYSRMEDIPERVDFAVIAVTAKLVPQALEDCLRSGVAGAEILSSGFGELGTQEGRQLEDQIREIAARGIRVVGPNCFGIYCPRSGLTMLPGPDLSRESGNVAFLAQSGGMASDFAHAGEWMGIRFSKMVSFGNGADLREAELLNYLARDHETEVISMYIEGIKDGDVFFRELKAAATRKPVIIFKGGLSAAGARSVASHTASMGGSGLIWSSVLKQTGAAQVFDTQELMQASAAFSLLPKKSFSNIAVIGGGGAIGVAACDIAERHGMEIPPLASDIRERIEAILPRPGSSALNPVDVANPLVAPSILKEVLMNAAQDERIDLQIIVSLLFHYNPYALMFGVPIAEIVPYKELVEAVDDVINKTGKPVVAVLPNARRGPRNMDITGLIALARREYVRRGIPVFDELHEAIRAIAHVNTYYGRRENEKR
ncbi:MAG TPA: CoA-binding protein [Smithellaceae bacterium]|jgi:acyl-CoA synthetase (NDP forming)|nr:CoA-binding protein [Syntrophaceae bacterium]HPV48078.1 CoA-binding protein [Smithellaceae bacterium]